jgi:CheY-like chemotaxis protein/signal transduction histidine kinase
MRQPGALRSEEIRALFEQGGPVLWANVGVGGVVVASLWHSAPAPRLLAWYGALLLMCAVRAVFQGRFRRARPDNAQTLGWGRRFVVGSCVSGTLWGTAALLFFASGDQLAQGMLTFAIAGMTAAAAGTLACHLPAFFGFFVPALAPLALSALREHDRFHYGLSTMILAYAVGMARVAFNNHRAYSRALTLGVANSELLQALATTEVELREANRTLEQRVQERTRTLEQQAEALRRAQRLEVAGRLAGSLAHDFNSLLTVVINNASLLRASSALTEQEQHATAEVLEAGRRGAALIRQLLALSRRKRAEPRPFSLNELVAEWGELLLRILGEGVTVELALSATDTHVLADPAYVEQVLLSLVLGTRAAQGGGGRLRLATRVAAQPNEAPVELWVEHAGARVEAEPTHAADTYLSFDSDTHGGKTGLSAVWSTAEQWGGRVLVEQEPDLTRYRIQFPAIAELVTPSRDVQASLVAPRAATVLVVDDEPTLRAVMRRALTRDGHAVLEAEDGARALSMARAHSGAIDLLLTDVVMPGLSGLELARRLEAERPGLAVLFVSGFTFEEAVPPTDVERGIAYLPKPFDTVVLTDKVRELLVSGRAKKARSSQVTG